MFLGKKELKVPVIQGGMGVGVSMWRLAGAVAKEGGMGVISSVNAGYDRPDFRNNTLQANLTALKEAIQKARILSEGNGLIGVNIMTAVSHYKETCEAAIEAGADAIISGAGLPLALAELTKGTKTLFAPIVSSGKAAALLCRHYLKKQQQLPDFMIIEGSMAGGHLGFAKEDLMNHSCQTNDEILSDVLGAIQPFEDEQQKKIPVFVAGGVYTSEDVRHYLTIGAAGVQVGTRFIATDECDASDRLKKAVLDATKEDIRIIQSPVGMPARAIFSPMLQRVEQGEAFYAEKCNGCLTKCPKNNSIPYCISRALIEAVQGNWEDGLFFCGENAWRIHKIISVRELMAELTEEI